jgi:hypothetical protein
LVLVLLKRIYAFNRTPYPQYILKMILLRWCEPPSIRRRSSHPHRVFYTVNSGDQRHPERAVSQNGDNF